jgi:outer membrane protein OmpA-like peptidoglycan-associated protein
MDMRYFCAVLAVAFVFVSLAGTEAAAGKKRPDSRALCYIGTPWPWLPGTCGCGGAGMKAANRSIDEFMSKGVLATSEIVFETDSAELKSESMKVLDRLGKILSDWPEAEVEISGHTDSSGEDDYNQALSEKRAEAVKAYLVENFPELRPNNLRTAGYGEKRPEASNDTAGGRRQNRRVEFRILNLVELQR